MAICPFAFTDHMLTEPGTFGKNGTNGRIRRIVVHHTAAAQSISNQAGINKRWWTKLWIDPPPGVKRLHASAHFTIEANGAIFQHVDTDGVGYGTACFTAGAVHIEHAGNTEPFTRAQLHASALLIAWVKSISPDLSLAPAGTGLSDFGDKDQLGITCHAFSDLAAIKFKNPYAPKSAKVTCPGKPMMGSLDVLAKLAVGYANAVPTVTSTVAATAATFFDWSESEPRSW
jgi:hypothetical protein